MDVHVFPRIQVLQYGMYVGFPVALNILGITNPFENLMKIVDLLPRKRHVPTKFCIYFRACSSFETHQIDLYNSL